MLVHAGRHSGVVQMVGNGENHWTLVHVDDLADCYVRALEQAPAGTLLNAASEQILSVKAVAQAASQAAGIPGQVQPLSIDHARQMMGAFADALAIEQRVSGLKARHHLGWTPQGPSVLEELDRGSYVSLSFNTLAPTR